MKRLLMGLAGGVIAFAVLGFLGLVAGLYVFQRALIYPVPPLDPDLPAGFERISYETADGLTIHAGYRPPAEGKPTLLFFHGNATDWQSTFHTTELLAANGYGVLAAEYRGYDGNPGEPSEEALYRDGAAAYDWLLARVASPQDIVIVGNSLGSGVATELASKRPARALILIAAFKTMTATAAKQYPFAPVDWLLKDRFDNIAKITSVAMPVLVVHGSEDQLIPLAHARELAAAKPGAMFVAVPGFGHNFSGEEAAQAPQLAFLKALAD